MGFAKRNSYGVEASLSLILHFFIALVLLGFCKSALAGETQWLEVRSPHFSVVTDAGEKRGRDVAIKFEQMRVVFGALFTKANVNLPIPLQIVAFRNTKELRQFAPLWNGKPTQVAGLFLGADDRKFILLDMSVEDPWTVVFHEYGHQLLNGNLERETQLWFDEGFAEYFSSITIDKDHAEVGHKAPPGDWEVLHQFSLMKMSDLVRVRHDVRVYNEGDRRSLFYAQSWLLVHYLYDTQQVVKAMQFFDLVDQKHLSPEAAFQQSFGMSTEQFDKVLQKYLAMGQVRFAKINTPPGIETTGYTVTPISLIDAQATLADVHLHHMDYQKKAVEEFQAILKVQPENAAALRGLGYVALRKGDFASAGQFFRKAAEHDSRDPRVHYYSARLMNQEGAFLRDPEKVATMIKELQTSIALDPNFADAYNLLAFAYRAAGDERALPMAIKAVELSPRNPGYLFNVAMIYLLQKKVDEAAQILASLENNPDQQVAFRAQESLAQVRQMQELIKSGAHVTLLPAEGGEAVLVQEKSALHSTESSSENEEPKPVNLPSVPANFLKGKLVKVDCSAAPTAILTVVSGTKTWKMKVADTRHAIVIGADNFSCNWTNQKIALNYHPTGDAEGAVMSVEIQ